MPTSSARTRAATPRDMLMWAALGLLAIGQLVAFWMLCSQQVARAQTRDAAAPVQRVAMADCQRAMPRSTFYTCADRAHRD
ncbi:hypothetical protein [Caenimonas aquaedulcis]|uniref:Uncharacterized protein n=1 Tax=Caenimonas aquaedulcis TaxID=2793270 RepID=A0A931H4B9_9BURK|nr:hypothetical protein [Caenimonas aquaedulcis]MBG9388257.1 hypothetical protein [Caenimonas aquaedulcis]